MKPFRLEQIRKEQWILLLLVGILIMTAVFPSGKERESMAGSTTESESQSSPQEEADLEELTWYEKRLEAKAPGLFCTVCGAHGHRNGCDFDLDKNLR